MVIFKALLMESIRVSSQSAGAVATDRDKCGVVRTPVFRIFKEALGAYLRTYVCVLFQLDMLV